MKTSRYYYIDSLRVIAILMMFVYHVFMVFVAEWNWHIKNAETSNMLLEINYWMAFFRMPLLFFISGYISYILMQRLHWKEFTIQRFIRLIIPTIIWTFILVAPQIYFERKLEGIDQNYIEFYQSFLEFKWWPNGNFHWLHLWFIPYLFCYNILSIPLFYALQKKNKLILALNTFFKKPNSIFVFVFVAILPYTFLSVHYKTTHDLINDIARHSFFIFFIIAGLLFCRFQQVMGILKDKRRLFLKFAFFSIVIINVLRWNGWEPFDIWVNWIEKPQTYLFIGLLNFNSWMWVFSSLGYGKRYFNKNNKLLNYMNTAVYPFYILHQTVIVILAYYVVQTKDEISLKILFLIFVCFFIIIIIYHLFISPYNAMRFIFGMKRKEEKALKDNKELK
ncbi:acyltransferase family protein [uncultured Maribacter sp.]|uniref:acyltransferase family protein n=1 Tax=uncultured Maribacter sp. TaxID=431308 RepID=UPI002634BFF9|nr:acyltransferase family protein [uncultured Maribacter sp.]